MRQAVRHVARVAALALGITALAAWADADHEPTSLGYTPPVPGSYTLPMMQPALDGAVLDSNGKSLRLGSLYGDKIVVLSFIYGACNDEGGCPLATHTLNRLKHRVKKEPSLANHLRLISLSFDHVRDTPEAMARYGAEFIDSEVEWRFLTTRSQSELQPLLDGYNQAIVHEKNEEGKSLGSIAHVLRVFLIDRQHRIRNIYSTSFLHQELLLNDIKTLMLETPAQHISNTTLLSARPGDDKRGYESAAYRTRSISLHRRGQSADLSALASTPPLGLPPLPVVADNPISQKKIALGRKLFYDRRLSLNGTMSCAMCHIPEHGFTNNELATAVGIEGRTVRRNAPTIYNSAYLEQLFHDGREKTLEQQIWGPLLARNEMGNPSVGAVIGKLRRLTDYAGLFEAAFDGKGATMETLGMAIASYERTLISAGSPFDRWYYGKQPNSLSQAARRGYKLFVGSAGCVACHHIGKEWALFTDQQMHNTGIGYAATMEKEPPSRRTTVAPGVALNISSATIAVVSEPVQNDLGLYEISQQPQDRWKYKTPSLRNVALTAPYMHDGSLTTLRDVIEFYSRGGIPNPLLDPAIKTLNLDQKEINDLVAFLEALTGDNVNLLVSDAFAAPIGDVSTENVQSGISP